MKLGELIDLSHPIAPETGPRPVRLERVPPPEMRELPRDQWYVMHRVGFLNHVGTHIETPYHVVEGGNDLAAVPLDRLCGEAVILDLTGLPPGADVTLEEIRAAAERAGGIRNGDIVFCRFDFDRYYGRPDAPQAPWFASGAIEWLIGRGMKMMGVDSGGVELPPRDPRASRQHNHHLLLDRGIPLIENLAGLGRVPRARVTVFAFPVAVERLDSFPVRVVASLD
jgi:arylformamidase